MAVLAVDNVGYEREGKPVLSGVSLQTSARRIGLVGRNGSGKSSFIRLIAGLAKPDTGSIRVFGKNPEADRAAALRTVGMIFQNPDHQIIFPTIGEELAFGLENLGFSDADRKQKIEDVLGRFDWQGLESVPVHTLSHGQKHLLCLMAVLVMEPRLVIFDEPYAGLDRPTARHMKKIVRSLNKNVMVISHDPMDFEGFDELIWLEAGNLQAHGPVSTVLPAYLQAMDTDGAGC